ncbi:hypothetical protein SS50377_27397 [Spironucleus salmonicida]|uniref:Uncharacterized protein n=1 Tax=Spironucleus salmonicida TaxID=348837 RepID=V6LHX9_9EUKA|nr:hypothetical protein SS50377_27397 [Spironucleus salmonicida]|eukprot:EST43311.1 Hypothetical protein SS50377_ja025 [Spironucleus salmonicida]
MTQLTVTHSDCKQTVLSLSNIAQNINDLLSPLSSQLAHATSAKKRSSLVNYDIFQAVAVENPYLIQKHSQNLVYIFTKDKIIFVDVNSLQVQYETIIYPDSQIIQADSTDSHIIYLSSQGTVYICSISLNLQVSELCSKCTAIGSYKNYFITGNPLGVLKFINQDFSIFAQLPLGIGQITQISSNNEFIFVSSISGKTIKLNQDLTFYSRESRNSPALFYNENGTIYAPDIMGQTSLSNSLSICRQSSFHNKVNALSLCNGATVIQEQDHKPYIVCQVNEDQINIMAKQVMHEEKCQFNASSVIIDQYIFGIGPFYLFKMLFVGSDQVKDMHQQGIKYQITDSIKSYEKEQYESEFNLTFQEPTTSVLPLKRGRKKSAKQ